MARKFPVRYLPAAEEDLLSIYDRIAKDNPARARAFIRELDVRIGALSVHPFLGRVPRLPKLQDLRSAREHCSFIVLYMALASWTKSFSS